MPDSAAPRGDSSAATVVLFTDGAVRYCQSEPAYTLATTSLVTAESTQTYQQYNQIFDYLEQAEK